MDILAKIESVRQELNAENQHGASKDPSKVAELESQLNELIQELEDMNRTSQHEAKIEESHIEIAYIMDTMTVDGISMRELCNGEEAYQLLRAVYQSTLLERDESRLKEIKDIETQLVTVKNDRDKLQVTYDELYEVNASLRTELNATKAVLDDMNRKRGAAGIEISDSKAEIERLNSQVDDLRKEIAIGARNAYKVTDINTGELVEAYKKQKQLVENAKPAIYDIQPLDNLRKRFTAKYAETDEVLEFGFMEKGKYREVTADEAPSFRREESQSSDADIERDLVEESELTPPTFQSEGPINGVAEGYEIGDMATKTVEERIEALEGAQDVINSALAALARRTGGMIQEDEMKVA